MGVAYLFYKGVKKIPSACITVEDTEMMARMAAQGTKIVINLKMEAKMLPPAISRNTVAEVKGSVYPEQVFHFFLQLIRNQTLLKAPTETRTYNQTCMRRLTLRTINNRSL